MIIRFNNSINNKWLGELEPGTVFKDEAGDLYMKLNTDPLNEGFTKTVCLYGSNANMIVNFHDCEHVILVDAKLEVEC